MHQVSSDGQHQPDWYEPSGWSAQEMDSHGHDQHEPTGYTEPRQAKGKCTAVEIGRFNQGQERWLSLSGPTRGRLANFIEEAKLKGWQQIPMYEGTDPATGWPTVWMTKPVEAVPVQPVDATGQVEAQAPNGQQNGRA